MDYYKAKRYANNLIRKAMDAVVTGNKAVNKNQLILQIGIDYGLSKKNVEETINIYREENPDLIEQDGFIMLRQAANNAKEEQKEEH